MITKPEATHLAADHVKALNAGCSEEFALAADQTLERDQCYVFFYNTKRFLETHDDRYRLAGNGPILVSKLDGYLQAYGSSRPVEALVSEFERRTTTTS
jgi:hypothetical protein